MSTPNIFTIERSTGVVTASENPLLVYNDVVPISIAFTDSGVVSTNLIPFRAALAVNLRLGTASGMMLAQAVQFDTSAGYSAAILKMPPEVQDRLYLSDGVVWLEFVLSEKTGPSSRHTVESLIDLEATGAPVDLNNAALTGTATADAIHLNVVNLGTIASGTVTLSTTKAANRAALTGNAATIQLPATPISLVHGLDFTTGASIVTATLSQALTRDDGDGSTPVTTVQFRANTNCSLRFRALNGAFVGFSAAGSVTAIPTSDLESVSNGSALDTVDTAQLARSVDVAAHVAARTLPISTSVTLAEDSDAHLATQKAVKKYVDDNAGGVRTVSTMASTEVDVSLADLFLLTLAANSSLTWAGVAANNRKRFEVRVTNPSTYTLGYPANTYWPGGTPPVVTTGGKVSRLYFEVDGSTVIGSASDLNYSIDNIKPTFTSLTFQTLGTTAHALFDEPVEYGADGISGFTITMSGGAVTFTYLSGSGTNTLVFTCSRTILASETCSDLDYTQPGAGIRDLAGNYLDTFTNQHAKVYNSSTATGYESRENFNSAGASPPSGFSVAYGTITWNSTTSPLEGAQSVRTNGGAFDRSLTPADVKWARCIVKPGAGGSNSAEVKFRDVANVVLGGVDVRSDGAFRVYAGSAYSTVAAGTLSGYSWGMPVYITMKYTKGTGANSELAAYLSIDATRPGSPTLNKVTGTATTQPTKVRFGATNANTDFDDIIISDNEIGSNP